MLKLDHKTLLKNFEHKRIDCIASTVIWTANISILVFDQGNNNIEPKLKRHITTFRHKIKQVDSAFVYGHRNGK